MKNSVHQHELMLVGNARMFNIELYSDPHIENSNSKLSALEKIEQVCWSGLLTELLPELFAEDKAFSKLYLLWVCSGTSSVQVMMSEDPAAANPNFSIDPLYFLPSVILN